MRVKAKNFLSWEYLEFEIGQGITLIDGFNHDDGSSEGSGKSAILSAIAWGGYGEIPKDANVDEVIRHGQKSCEVRLEHDDFTIVRSRGPNDLCVYYPGKDKPYRGKDARETQKHIEKLLGMTFKTFCQSIYFPQNYPNKFVTANQEDKGRILSEILDLEQFDRARKIAADKIKVKKEQLIGLEKDVSNLSILLQASEDNVSSSNKQIDEFNSNKAKKIQKMFEELALYSNREVSFIQEFNELKAESINKKTLEIEKCDSDVVNLVTAQNNLKQEIKSKTDELKSLSEASLGEELKQAQAQINELKVGLLNLEQNKKADKQKHRDLELKLKEESNLLKSQSDNDKSIEGLKDQIEEAVENIKELVKHLENPDQQNCPTCGQVWNGDLSKIEATLEVLAKKETSLNSRLVDLQDVAKNQKSSLKEVKETIKNLRTEIAEQASYSEIEESLNLKLKAAEAMYRSAEVALKTISRLNQEVELARVKIENLDSNLKAKNQQKDQLLSELSELKGQTVEDHPELKRIQEFQGKLALDIEALDSEEPSSLLEALERHNNLASKYSKALNDAKLKLDYEKHEALQLEAIRDGFKEVKVYTFEKTLNLLNQKANRYLADLFRQPVKVKFSAEEMKINTTVTIDGVERNLALYSGGQARRIYLAVDLALSDLTLSRKGCKFPMICLDEVFKDLSETSMERMLEVLAKRTTPTLIIEHNSLIKSIVSKSITVELRDGISRFSE